MQLPLLSFPVEKSKVKIKKLRAAMFKILDSIYLRQQQQQQKTTICTDKASEPLVP